jgi:hypothetical protein
MRIYQEKLGRQASKSAKRAGDRKDVMDDGYFLRKFTSYCRDREDIGKIFAMEWKMTIYHGYIGC